MPPLPRTEMSVEVLLAAKDPYYDKNGVTVYQGDAMDVLSALPPESVHCVVTSPPYWGLRDYGVEGQLGLEPTPEEYVENMVGVFREVRRVLRDDGTLWLNLGDSYAGSWGAQSRGGPPSESSTLQGNGHIGGGPKLKSMSAVQIANHPKTTMTGSLDRTPGLKPKDLVGIPWRVAFALQDDGWYLRSDIIWHKPNPMPESVTDRPTKAHEYVFLLTKSARYAYDADAVREDGAGRMDFGRMKRPEARSGEGGAWSSDNGGKTEADGRNLRTVWTVATHPFAGAHFATFPPKLIEPCIKAGCPAGGTVLDPFWGAGTVSLVAMNLSCRSIGVELNAEYIGIGTKRLEQGVLPFGGMTPAEKIPSRSLPRPESLR